MKIKSNGFNFIIAQKRPWKQWDSVRFWGDSMEPEGQLKEQSGWTDLQFHGLVKFFWNLLAGRIVFETGSVSDNPPRCPSLLSSQWLGVE